MRDICKGTTKDAITIAKRVSLPKNCIQDNAYAKKEQIIRGIRVEGMATAKVLMNACPIPSLNNTSL